MSDRHPAFSIISDMENNVRSVARYGALLGHLSDSPHSIQPDMLSALSDPLIRIGKELEEAFEAAFRAAGGEP